MKIFNSLLSYTLKYLKELKYFDDERMIFLNINSSNSLPFDWNTQPKPCAFLRQSISDWVFNCEEFTFDEKLYFINNILFEYEQSDSFRNSHLHPEVALIYREISTSIEKSFLQCRNVEKLIESSTIDKKIVSRSGLKSFYPVIPYEKIRTLLLESSFNYADLFENEFNVRTINQTGKVAKGSRNSEIDIYIDALLGNQKIMHASIITKLSANLYAAGSYQVFRIMEVNSSIKMFWPYFVYLPYVKELINTEPLKLFCDKAFSYSCKENTVLDKLLLIKGESIIVKKRKDKVFSVEVLISGNDMSNLTILSAGNLCLVNNKSDTEIVLTISITEIS